MNEPSLYLNLCTQFFDLDKPVAPQEEYDFYREYVKRAQGPSLEPMCGSGRYLIPMLEAGYAVDGVDASPFMLDSLRARCTEKNLTPHVWQQFLQDMDCSEQYSLAFIPDSSFCLFLEEKQITAALQKIYECLQPGGTFVFDLETIYATPAKVGIWQGKVHTRPDGKYIIMNSLPLPIENQIATVICRYELVDKTEIIATEMEHFKIRLYHPAEMITLLSSIGFKEIRRVKAYDHSTEPDAYDYTVVYECRK